MPVGGEKERKGKERKGNAPVKGSVDARQVLSI